MSNIFIGLGALGAMLAVIAGAFGAHGLKQVLSEDMLAVFHTAAEYQMYHSLGLFAIGTLHTVAPRHCHILAAWIMLAGIIIFSGSLYTLSLSDIKWLGMITPIGGVCFIAAWLILAFSYLTTSKNKAKQL